MQRVVAPPAYQQKYTGSGVADYAGGGMMGSAEAMEESSARLGGQMMSKGQQAAAALGRSKDIRTGASLGDVDNRERGMLQQIEQVLTQIAEDDNLIAYRTQLETVLKTLMKASQAKTKV
jgi:hypothetical protein